MALDTDILITGFRYKVQASFLQTLISVTTVMASETINTQIVSAINYLGKTYSRTKRTGEEAAFEQRTNTSKWNESASVM